VPHRRYVLCGGEHHYAAPSELPILSGIAGQCRPTWPFPGRGGRQCAHWFVGTAPAMFVTWTPIPGGDPTKPASPKAKIPPSDATSQ